MISFQPSEDEKAFVEIAKDLAIKKIRPLARTCENNGVVNESLYNEIKNLGILSLELTENWEGLELNLISQVQILKALSYGDLDVVQGLLGVGDGASLLRLLHDHPAFTESKTEITAKDETIAVIDNVIEFGSSLSVQKNGEGYLINGTTQPIRLGKFAKYVGILTYDDHHEALLLWIDNSNWKVEEGDYRLGLLASGLGRLTFKNVKLSHSNILARGNEAEQLFSRFRTRHRILQAAKEVGLMEAALDYATEYTAGRKAFGQEIAKFQGVSFRIAAMAIETRIANHLVWDAALQADEDEVKAEGVALQALYRAHRSLRFVTDSSVQLLGGHGYVQEYPVEKWMRDAAAQVALYGREQILLRERGKKLLDEETEVAYT